MLNVTITRYRKLSESIDGRLTIDGEPVCDTAENFWSLLPVGQYTIEICKCKQYARKMPLVISKCGRDCFNCPKKEFVNHNTKMPKRCAMLKPGNGIHNRKDGSIIVGEFLVPGCLIHPKQAFDTLYQRLRKSAERGHEIRLTIEEDYMINPHGTLSLGTKALAAFSGRKVACEQ